MFKANSTDGSTVGVTLTVDFAGSTGTNQYRIDLNSTTFYAAKNDYSVLISTGTINSISVKGRKVGAFSIEHNGEKRKRQQIRALLEGHGYRFVREQLVEDWYVGPAGSAPSAYGPR